MDDNACSRRAAIVDDYLQSKEIARMTWPAYSPNFSPNEKLRDGISHAVSLRFSLAAILTELKTALQDE